MTPDQIFSVGVQSAMAQLPAGSPENFREFLEEMRSEVVGLMVQVDAGTVSPPALPAEFRKIVNTARLVHAMGGSIPGHRPIVCKSGCSHCCERQDVIAVALGEALAVLVRVMSRSDLPQLKEALRRASGPGSHRCPLLTADGACSVYEARPLVCAAYNSLDATPCQEHRPTHPMSVAVDAVGNVLRGALILFTLERINVSELALWPALLAGIEELEVSGKPDRVVRAMEQHTAVKISEGVLGGFRVLP